jgi:peroxiredoxin
MKKAMLLILTSVLFSLGTQVKGQSPTSALDVSPLLIGENAPDASVADTKGNPQLFLSLIKDKPVVVIFYRGDWCSNCIAHFNAEISPNMATIKSLGYDLIAISPDSPENLIKTSGKVNMDQSLFFSDADGSLSKAFGIAWKQGDRMKDMMIQSSGGKNLEPVLPVPAVYVIGTDKKITFEYINPLGPQSNLRMKWTLLQPVLQALKN